MSPPYPAASFSSTHGPLGAAVSTHHLPLGFLTSSGHTNFYVLNQGSLRLLPTQSPKNHLSLVQSCVFQKPEQKVGLGPSMWKSRCVKDLRLRRMGWVYRGEANGAPSKSPQHSTFSYTLTWWTPALIPTQVPRTLPEGFLWPLEWARLVYG